MSFYVNKVHLVHVYKADLIIMYSVSGREIAVTSVIVCAVSGREMAVTVVTMYSVSVREIAVTVVTMYSVSGREMAVIAVCAVSGCEIRCHLLPTSYSWSE